MNSNKSGGSDPWSFLVCDGANTSVSFGGALTINVAGTLRSDHRFLEGLGSSATYAGVVTVNSATSATVITMGSRGLSTYNQDIILSNTAGATGIYFNTQGTAASTLAPGRTISIGGGGFSGGTLSLIRFTQLGTTPQSLTAFTGTSTLILGPTSTFNGNVNFRSPQVYLNGTVYNGTAIIEKSGTGDNSGNGGNTFNGISTITNSGTGYLMSGNVTADAFNAAATINNTGSNRVYLAHNHSGQTTTFTDLTVNSNKTSGTDQFPFVFCEGATTNFTVSGNTTLNCAGAIRSEFRFLAGSGTTAVFGGSFTVNNTNTNAATVISLGVAGVSTYNGNIVVSNSGGSAGVVFNSGSTASSTLANSRTISIGAGGFTSGTLSLFRFSQLGNTAQSLNTFGGVASLIVGPGSLFDGVVNFVAPQIYLNGATYNSAAYFEKTGATNNDNSGGNVFNGATTIANSSTVRLRLASANADVFNGSATFVKNSTGALEPAYNLVNTFGGNVTVNSNTLMTLGAGTGTVEFNGGANQTVSKGVGTPSPVFQRISMNKSGGAVTLNTDAVIGASALFTRGVVNTTTTNFLNFADNATSIAANDLSYVNGPVRKTGNDIFTFPVGAAGFYRPISITAPSNAAHQFTAQYFKTGQTFGGAPTWDASFYTVSGCEYWTLDRTSGTSNVSVTLSWNDAACGGAGYITNPATLRVTRWTGMAWVNHGNGGNTGGPSSGTVVTAAVVTAFSPFTLASGTPTNPLPVSLVNFKAISKGDVIVVNWTTASEKNNKGFILQRSSNMFDFKTVYEVKGAGTTAEPRYYGFTDDGPFPGLSYYKLIQTDWDGNSEERYCSVTHTGNDFVFDLYPNPAGDEIITFSQKVSIVVVNMLDQVVAREDEVTSMDVSGLASGVYLIRNQKGQIARLVKR
jgi:hypothetical protein